MLNIADTHAVNRQSRRASGPALWDILLKQYTKTGQEVQHELQAGTNPEVVQGIPPLALTAERNIMNY